MWDKDEYEKLTEKRLMEEREKKDGKPVRPVKRELLWHRDYKVKKRFEVNKKKMEKKKKDYDFEERMKELREEEEKAKAYKKEKQKEKKRRAEEDLTLRRRMRWQL
ncbi:Zinc finger matrin-type protein 2, partial [Eschrichtius robustus]|nr:Zinc finger matrin-type protein 2 [Eschrichtius robustus]